MRNGDKKREFALRSRRASATKHTIESHLFESDRSASFVAATVVPFFFVVVRRIGAGFDYVTLLRYDRPISVNIGAISYFQLFDRAIQSDATKVEIISLVKKKIHITV